MPFHRFEGLETQRLNPHLSTGEGRTIDGRYMYFRTVHKNAGTGSELHYHPNELMIFPLRGKLNAVVGMERRIVFPGTFVHCPPNARHSMRATEDGDVDYLYIKDRTWSLIGVAADEAPPERAPTPQEVARAHRAGKWPGGVKAPEKSQAIIEGLGECYYPIVDFLDAPAASGHREHWVHGERLAFGFVEKRRVLRTRRLSIFSTARSSRRSTVKGRLLVPAISSTFRGAQPARWRPGRAFQCATVPCGPHRSSKTQSTSTAQATTRVNPRLCEARS